MVGVLGPRQVNFELAVLQKQVAMFKLAVRYEVPIRYLGFTTGEIVGGALEVFESALIFVVWSAFRRQFSKAAFAHVTARKSHLLGDQLVDLVSNGVFWGSAASSADVFVAEGGADWKVRQVVSAARTF